MCTVSNRNFVQYLEAILQLEFEYMATLLPSIDFNLNIHFFQSDVNDLVMQKRKN
jgi:hypothetical protein